MPRAQEEQELQFARNPSHALNIRCEPSQC